MKYTENALNILTAKTFKGIGDVWINKNLTTELPFEVIVELLKNDKKCKENVSEDIFITIRNNIRENIEKLENVCDGIVAIGDPNFPEYRGNVKDADKPNVLFYKGDLGLLSKDNFNVAVIGVLNPDTDTETDERKFVHSLVQNDAVIVSGLALGCDTIAHDQAVKSQGVTIAILPSTLGKIIPKENRELADEIVSTGGLLISEYYDEAKSANDLAGRFVKRDRLQALFSDIVVLSASYTPNSKDPNSDKIDSGSRHAMAKANEYGIGKAVLYNEKYSSNPKYDLNRQIIHEDRYVIVVDPDNMSKGIEQIIKNQDSLTSISDDMFSLSVDLNEESKIANKKFSVIIENSKLTFYKGKDIFSTNIQSDVIDSLISLLEYYLNENLYEATLHNGIGFIKCFNDVNKTDYLMAIKLTSFINEKDQAIFKSFFECN